MLLKMKLKYDDWYVQFGLIQMNTKRLRETTVPFMSACSSLKPLQLEATGVASS